jgi:tetratricopeptide (TPR) repeat protein
MESNDDAVFQKKNFVHSDSLLARYNKAKLENFQIGDTLAAIGSILEMSKTFASNGNYSKSYDGYWEALIYSKEISDSTFVNEIYTELGMLYSIFKRTQDAENYFNLSLKLQKKRSITTKKEFGRLSNTYHLLASHNRENGNYGIAQIYLDSCRVVSLKSTTLEKSPFVDAEQAYIYYHLGEYDKALELLYLGEDFFVEKKPAYLVIFYSFFGDVYLKKEDYRQSERFYLEALNSYKKYKNHSNYVPNIYQKLSELYLATGKMNLAYENLQLSKDITERMFGARSTNNSNIIEIKDAYRIENEYQKKILETARFFELEQNQKILFWRNMVLSISITSLFVVFGIIFWYLYKRRKSERLNFLNSQSLSEKNNTEILEFKNKELTSTALQLIQKDELILDIKEKLSSPNGSDKKEISQILRAIKINKSLGWKEFNARFTSVNSAFYSNLSERFPELTQRDHKLCALIKLNFSSKKISMLLGISMESVNTARYRLRKKMGLSPSDNLTEFITQL